MDGRIRDEQLSYERASYSPQLEGLLLLRSWFAQTDRRVISAHRAGAVGSLFPVPRERSNELFDVGVVVDGDADFEGSVEGADVVHEGGDFDFGEVGFEAGDAGLDPSPSLGDFGLGERCALFAELCEGGDDLVLSAELLGAGGDSFGEVRVVGVSVGCVDGAFVDVFEPGLGVVEIVAHGCTSG